MKMKRIRKTLSLFLCSVLIVAMALFTTGCNDNGKNETVTSGQVNANETTAVSTEETIADADTAVTVMGEGQTVFDFSVTDKNGNETKFEIHTDKTTVGEALVELGLIKGDEGQYGLYVKNVNGITADYDVDGTYWAFYVNGEYASSGVDTTTITAGESYSFKVEK